MQFRRFDWLAFLRHSETNQTNRLDVKPIRQRSQRPFPKSRDSTAVTSAPISETDVHCVHIIQFDTFSRTSFLAAFCN
jgi:hypothetical protein